MSIMRNISSYNKRPSSCPDLREIGSHARYRRTSTVAPQSYCGLAEPAELIPRYFSAACKARKEDRSAVNPLEGAASDRRVDSALGRSKGSRNSTHEMPTSRICH